MKKSFDKQSILQKYVTYRKLKIIIFKKACISMCKSSWYFYNKESEPRLD